MLSDRRLRCPAKGSHVILPEVRRRDGGYLCLGCLASDLPSFLSLLLQPSGDLAVHPSVLTIRIRSVEVGSVLTRLCRPKELEQHAENSL